MHKAYSLWKRAAWFCLCLAWVCGEKSSHKNRKNGFEDGSENIFEGKDTPRRDSSEITDEDLDRPHHHHRHRQQPPRQRHRYSGSASDPYVLAIGGRDWYQEEGDRDKGLRGLVWPLDKENYELDPLSYFPDGEGRSHPHGHGHGHSHHPEGSKKFHGNGERKMKFKFLNHLGNQKIIIRKQHQPEPKRVVLLSAESPLPKTIPKSFLDDVNVVEVSGSKTWKKLAPNIEISSSSDSNIILGGNNKMQQLQASSQQTRPRKPQKKRAKNNKRPSVQQQQHALYVADNFESGSGKTDGIFDHNQVLKQTDKFEASDAVLEKELLAGRQERLQQTPKTRFKQESIQTHTKSELADGQNYMYFNQPESNLKIYSSSDKSATDGESYAAGAVTHSLGKFLYNPYLPNLGYFPKGYVRNIEVESTITGEKKTVPAIVIPLTEEQLSAKDVRLSNYLDFDESALKNPAQLFVQLDHVNSRIHAGPSQDSTIHQLSFNPNHNYRSDYTQSQRKIPFTGLDMQAVAAAPYSTTPSAAAIHLTFGRQISTTLPPYTTVASFQEEPERDSSRKFQQFSQAFRLEPFVGSKIVNERDNGSGSPISHYGKISIFQRNASAEKFANAPSQQQETEEENE